MPLRFASRRSKEVRKATTCLATKQALLRTMCSSSLWLDRVMLKAGSCKSDGGFALRRLCAGHEGVVPASSPSCEDRACPRRRLSRGQDLVAEAPSRQPLARWNASADIRRKLFIRYEGLEASRTLQRIKHDLIQCRSLSLSPRRAPRSPPRREERQYCD